jgi:hypothetical protein
MVPTELIGQQSGITIDISDVLTPTRSLLFYTLTATLPILVITVVLLAWPSMNKQLLLTLSVLGAVTGFGALGRLLYELTYDILGDPDYKLPIWAVLLLIVYLVSAFTFVFFGLHLYKPGTFFDGFTNAKGGEKTAFLDALYLSLSDYIGVSPDSSISLKTQGVRFLTLIQGVLSMFVNVVIITKFVSTI